MSAAAVLAMMLNTDPKIETVAHRDTFESSAIVIAKVSADSPIFAGPDAVERTEALLVALGFHEGSLKPDAAGDCSPSETDPKTGMCLPGGTPHSFCMFQVHESNFAALKTTRTEVQSDFEVCARSAITMLRASLSICRGRPQEELLGNYASGGGLCGGPKGQGLAKSRTRVLLAKKLRARSVARGD